MTETNWSSNDKIMKQNNLVSYSQKKKKKKNERNKTMDTKS